MRSYLVNNHQEWLTILIKLYGCGYRWAYDKKYDPALSFDDWWTFNDIDKYPETINGEKFPIIVTTANDNVLHYCSIEYLKHKYPNDYDKLIRKEKLKRLNAL